MPSSTSTAPPTNWCPWKLAACRHELRNTYVAGNLQANKAAFLVAIKAEIASNGLASTWAKTNAYGKYMVVVKLVPGAKAP